MINAMAVGVSRDESMKKPRPSDDERGLKIK